MPGLIGTTWLVMKDVLLLVEVEVEVSKLLVVLVFYVFWCVFPNVMFIEFEMIIIGF